MEALQAIQRNQQTQQDELNTLRTQLQAITETVTRHDQLLASGVPSREGDPDASMESQRERPSFARVVQDGPPDPQRRALSQPRVPRVRFGAAQPPVRAQSADPSRQVRVSGFSEPLTIDELRAAATLILPLPDGVQISSRARFDTKAIITLSSAAEAQQLLSAMRASRYQHQGAALYGNRVLEPHQALLGWRLRQAKRTIAQHVDVGVSEITVCYRSATIFVQRRVACFWREDTLHFGPAFPAAVDRDALLQELRSRG